MNPDLGASPLDKASTRALERILPAEGDPPDSSTVARFRALIQRIAVDNGPGPEMVSVTERLVPASPDPVRVVLLQPIPDPRGLIVSLGLGGWVAGSPESEETLARKIAERTSCTVALIDHRRAPENPCPAGPDDVYVAARWLWENRDALGIPATPMMILGEGMGATLAAVTVDRALADPDGPRFALQFLICPVVDAAADDVDVSCSPLLSRAMLNEFWASYVPDPDRRDDPAVSPVGVPQQLPPTVIVTAEHDVVREEGLEYVKRLQAAGLPVAHRHYDGQIHGFVSILAIPLGERVLQHVIRAVRGYTARFGGSPPQEDLGTWLDRIIK